MNAWTPQNPRESRIRPIFLLLAAGALVALGTGCGDVVGATGEHGNLYYALHTDYENEFDDLDDNRLITGYDHHLSVYLTSQGQDDVDRPSEVVHTLVGDGVAEFSQVDNGPNSVPDLIIDVTTPGPYTIESRLDGRLVDQLDLAFDTPDYVELVGFVRGPWDDDFDPINTDLQVIGEGSQLMFVPIPTTSTGHRLVGDISTVVEIEPEWAAVPGMNVNGVYEDGYWGLGGADSWYIIEPGIVTFRFIEVVSGAMGELSFDVQPANPDAD